MMDSPCWALVFNQGYFLLAQARWVCPCLYAPSGTIPLQYSFHLLCPCWPTCPQHHFISPFFSTHGSNRRISSRNWVSSLLFSPLSSCHFMRLWSSLSKWTHHLPTFSVLFIDYYQESLVGASFSPHFIVQQTFSGHLVNSDLHL